MADRLPVELWYKIAALACTDGGRTARSLSLTCHILNEVVQPIRFTSAIIVSDTQLHSLARVLESTPIAKIQHLLFSIQCAPRRHFAYQSEDEPRREALQTSWTTIISRAAPTLRSLTVHEPPLFDPYAVDLSFPALENLSVPWLDCPRHARTPRLRRLHLSQTLQCTHQVWTAVASAAPQLTHVRFSTLGLSVGLGSRSAFAPYLRALLDVPLRDPPRPPLLPGEEPLLAPGSPGARDAAATAKALPFLREVYVQPQGGPLQGSVEYQREERVKIRVGVGRIMLDCEVGGRGKVYLLPECGQRYSLDEAREEFLDLVVGGDGPWTRTKASLAEDML